MGYSPTSLVAPLIVSASSTMFGLAWRAVTSSTSIILTPKSGLRRRSSPDVPESTKGPSSYNCQPLRSRVPSSTSQMELRLSTCCHSCGAKVSLEVPKWISDSIDIAQNNQGCDGSCRRLERFGANGEDGTSTVIRKFVVNGSISLAQAVKASPIIPILFAAVKAFIAFVIYLDARFLLRQQAGYAVTEIASGLVEIEKELGLLRNAGEGLSIGWEALIKGILALVTTDSSSAGETPEPDCGPSAAFNKSYPCTRLDSFEDVATYHYEPVSPTYSSTHRYLSTDMDESGAPTLSPPSPTCSNSHLSAPHYIPPLRRTPLSSPILRTQYTYGSSSATSTASSQYLHEARLASPAQMSHRPPSYSNGEAEYPFVTDPPVPTLHRRSRSGPDTSQRSSSTSQGVASWPTRTMLGWADKLLTRADTLHHR